VRTCVRDCARLSSYRDLFLSFLTQIRNNPLSFFQNANAGPVRNMLHKCHDIVAVSYRTYGKALCYISASPYLVKDLRTPNHKRINKPRHPECFRENLAIAKVANLVLATFALKFKPHEVVFACMRCFVVYPIRPYHGLFGLLARTGKGGVSTRYSTFFCPRVKGGVPFITIRLPCSYVWANQNTLNRVLEEPGPRGIFCMEWPLFC